MGNTIADAIEYARILVQAVLDGKIEARDIPGMSDEALESFIDRVKAEARAEVERGRELEQGH